jgi:hypothetical protein
MLFVSYYLIAAARKSVANVPSRSKEDAMSSGTGTAASRMPSPSPIRRLARFLSWTVPLPPHQVLGDDSAATSDKNYSRQRMRLLAFASAFASRASFVGTDVVFQGPVSVDAGRCLAVACRRCRRLGCGRCLAAAVAFLIWRSRHATFLSFFHGLPSPPPLCRLTKSGLLRLHVVMIDGLYYLFLLLI